MVTLFLVVLLFCALFGGGFFGYSRGYYGPNVFGGLGGVLILILVLYLVFGYR